jgi:hypothetical protein
VEWCCSGECDMYVVARVRSGQARVKNMMWFWTVGRRRRRE